MLNDYESTVLKLDLPTSSGISLATFRLRVKPSMMTADNAVKGKRLSLRKCLFPDESQKLAYFNVYTEKNCLFECRLNLARQACGCLPWYLTMDTSNSPVCGVLGNGCFHQEMASLRKLTVTSGTSPPCGCYKSCIETTYEVASRRDIKTDESTGQWLNIRGLRQYDRSLSNFTQKMAALQDAKLDQFLARYIVDFFNPNHTLPSYRQNPLDYDVQKEPSETNYRVKVDERAVNLALLYIDYDQPHYMARRKAERLLFFIFFHFLAWRCDIYIVLILVEYVFPIWMLIAK